MVRASLLLITLLSVPAASIAAGDAPLDRASLRGLKTLGVVIDQLDPELELRGITKDALQSEVEGRLQGAGLQLDKNAPEFLGLRVIHVRDSKGPYALCLSMGLYQPVLLVRDRNLRTATQTWEVESVLLAPLKLLFRSSMSEVDQLTDRFISAWRSANPE